METSDKQELTSRCVVKLETPENEVTGFLLYKPVASVLLVKHVRQKWEQSSSFSLVNCLYFFPAEESALFPVVVRKWGKIVQFTDV